VKATVRFTAAAVVSVSAFLGSLLADWPGFRGSKGGVADDKDLPAKVTQDNVLWKVKLPGPGASSPVASGDKVFLTCYTGYGTTINKGFGMGGFGKGGFGKGGFGKGKKGKGGFGKGGFGKGGFGGDGGDQKQLRFLVLCVDPKKGDVLWQKEIQPRLPEASANAMLREHGYSTSTPVTDGERLYVFFGRTGVLAFDLTGKQLWQTSVGTQTHIWGSASSPVLYKDLVIVNASIESDALVALNRKTGKEVWRTKGLGICWGSPIMVETKDGKQEVVLSLPGKVAGYDAESGKLLWHCKGMSSGGGGFGGGGFGGGKGFGGGGRFGPYTSSTPVARDGIVYVIGGGGPGSQASSLAVKAGGSGDVTQTHVVWKQRAGATHPSPVLSGDHLCWISGIAVSLNAADGKVAYKKRLYDSTSEYVSAVAADNKIYALTRSDGLYVLEGGRTFKELSHYEFKGDDSLFNASPAISDGRIFVRSNAYLYCLGNKATQ
jgi:outer membrane protein assembly factor BamB